MEARYTKLSYLYNELKPRPISDTDPRRKNDAIITTRVRSFGVWLKATWALALHCFLSLAIAGLVLFYLEGCQFNVTDRFPSVNTVGGTRIAPFFPMQSDIVTIISGIISVLKCALAAWLTSLCWHFALFLMERCGIAYWDLKTLLDYGFLAPGVYSKDLTTWLIGALLLASLIANFSSPILTGSVTWIPSSQLAHGLRTDPIKFEEVERDIITPYAKDYFLNERSREQTAFTGVGSVGLAWGLDTNTGTSKRVSRLVGPLSINSTIEAAFLPYFDVHSIQWIKNSDVDSIPGFKDLNKTTIAAPLFDSIPIHSPPRAYGSALLIPNATTNWSGDPMEPTLIRDTRLLHLYHGYDLGYEQGQPGDIHSITQHLPLDIYQLSDRGMYFVFAWVTFSAGAGRCTAHRCIVSSRFVIQNSTSIELEPHHFTFQALSMAPIISLHLALQNTSLPSPWGSINKYIEAVLVRSYSGAWNGLMETLVPRAINISYVPSFPSLRAQVNQKRVYLWLGIQLLVTLLSALFLIIQANIAKYPLRGGTILCGFHLDATGVPMRDKEDIFEGKMVLKIEPQGDGLKVKVA